MKIIKISKIPILISFILFLSACSFKDFKEELFERVKAKLSYLPFVNRYIKLYPQPKALYEETEKKIKALKLSKAREIYKKEYEELLKEWDSAKELYQKGYYKSAEKKLKEVSEKTDKLLSQVRDYEENLKTRALKLYQEKEKELFARVNPKKEEEYLKTRLYLLKLRNLIEMGEYEKFERELKYSPLQ